MKGPAHEEKIGVDAQRQSHENELKALRQSLQEQRRANTLLNAEVRKQIEAREAMEAQLIEANAEIADSWKHRKEMARIITDRDAKLTELKDLRATVTQLKAELQARYEELATLQRHIAHTSFSGRAKRLTRSVSRLFRRGL